jgi:hypothetical protein
MAALLEETRPSAPIVIDLLAGAIDAHLHRGTWRRTEGGRMEGRNSSRMRIPVFAGLALLVLPVLFLTLMAANGGGNGLVFPQLTGFFGNAIVETLMWAGPCVAFVLSLVTVTRVSFRRVDGALASTVTVRASAAHLVMLGISGATIALFVGYYLIERA